MIKEYVFISILLLIGLFLAACKNNDNNPITVKPNPTGSIYVISSPTSAQIWLDTMDTGKMTPDSLTNISVGIHKVILKLPDFLNDTVTVTVKEGVQIPLNVTLVSDQSVLVYGPIQIWESSGTTGLPSGIILKSGRPSLISSGGKDSVDIYYSSNEFVITTPNNSINNRSTSFFIGLSTNLNDSIMSPVAIPSWVSMVFDSEKNYFFLFDSDFHYSKMIITEKGGGTPGNPAWLKVQWLYNNKSNDRRF